LKKIKKALSADFGPLVLYLDDIEEIISFLKELTDNFSIETFNFEYEGFAELQKSSEDLTHSLKICSRSPFFEINIHGGSSHVYSSGGSSAEKGVFYSICELLKRKRRWFAHIFTKYLFSFWFLVGMGSVFGLFIGDFLGTYAKTGNKTLIFFPILAVIFLGIYLILSYFYLIFYLLKKGSLIYLSTRKNSPGFFMRNKDQLVLIFVSSVVTAILTYFVTIWLNK